MKCSMPNCEQPRYRTTSTCYEHYTERVRCDVADCKRLPVRAGKECFVHRQQRITGPAKTCIGPECDRRATAKELCSAHAKQRRKGQDLQPLRQQRYQPYCSFAGCGRPHLAVGYCSTHYQQLRAGKGLRPIPSDNRRGQSPRPACAYDGCDRLARGLSGKMVYCVGHHSQILAGQELRPLYEGRMSAGYVNAAGYRIVGVGGRQIMEHRYVMEKSIGRPLEPYENVHHRNGEKLDNRPENLELWVTRQPRGQRVSDLIAFVLKHYRPQLDEQLEQGPEDAS